MNLKGDKNNDTQYKATSLMNRIRT